MTIFEVGDTVRFKGGATPEQVRWAAADYPSQLTIGETYVIESIERESWCTRIILKGNQGKFNSVNFSKV